MEDSVSFNHDTTHAGMIARAADADFNNQIRRLNGHDSFSRTAGVISRDGKTVNFDPARWAHYVEDER